MHGIAAEKAANILTVLPQGVARFMIDLRALQVMPSNQILHCSVAEVWGRGSSQVTSGAELKPTKQRRKTIPA